LPKKLKVPIGKKFNRWEVIGCDKRGYWLCKCECGTIKSVRFDSLLDNTSKSCGCLKMEKWIERNLKYRNGEASDKRFYNKWLGMRDRCRILKEYIDRGTKVCERWKNDETGFLNFYQDMHESYLKHLSEHGPVETTLDRINNNGNYEPENCRWATHKVQTRNTKRQKRFLAIHESGIIEEANVVIDFCQKYYLDPWCVSYCIKGQQESHRGWRFKLINE